MPQLITKAQAERYENNWIAILIDEQRVVGSGSDALSASKEAEANGYSNAVLYKVLPSNSYYVPNLT
jgi:hypothetical protein